MTKRKENDLNQNDIRKRINIIEKKLSDVLDKRIRNIPRTAIII